MGVQFLVAILLFLFIGKWLDSRLGTSPWLLILGVFSGAAASTVAMYRRVFPPDKTKQADSSKKRPLMKAMVLFAAALVVIVLVAGAPAGNSVCDSRGPQGDRGECGGGGGRSDVRVRDRAVGLDAKFLVRLDHRRRAPVRDAGRLCVCRGKSARDAGARRPC